MSKDIGIIFQSDMVCAILDNRKTLTSRLRGLGQINTWPGDNWRYDGLNINGDHLFTDIAGLVSGHDPEDCRPVVRCPYGQAGDRLWVKETWCCKMDSGEFTYRRDGNHECLYRATEPYEIVKDDGDGGIEYRKDGTQASPWQSSMFMPRWASRITLEVVRTWPSRLLDMTEEMAIQEGAPKEFEIDAATFVSGRPINFESVSTHLLGYKHLWDRINSKPKGKKRGHPWESNPWVWRVQFKRITP